MKMYLHAATVALVALLAVPAAAEGLHSVDPRPDFSSVSRAYGDMDARYARTALSRPLSAPRALIAGQSVAEVDALMGPALRRDGNAAEYIVALPLAGGQEILCQYMAFFDDGEGLAKGVWRRSQCANLVTRG